MTNDFADCELAWASKGVARMFRYMWNGMLQGNMKNKEVRIHPTQKPVALYKWLLKNYAKPGDTILDTHVGSASSLIACLDMGFKFIGYEKDPQCYKDSNKRMQQHLLQMRMEF
jgi:site-specific DNA-methyltransferase (adenine-specific)